MSERKLSRRSLLKTWPLALAAGLSGCSPEGYRSESERTNETDGCEEGSVWQRPPKQQGNNLNLILLVSDTFRADNLACYGSQWVECPNLNRFAEESVVFEDFYPEGLPTVPARRTLWTGRRAVPFHYYRQHDLVQKPGWHPLYNEDVTLSETLLEAGYVPALIADVPHLQKPGRNFDRGYRHAEWVRGQTIDYYGTARRLPADFSDMVTEAYLERILRERPDLGRFLFDFLAQYRANRRRWMQEGESLVEVVARAAIRWLKENHGQGPFFLHFETFDPHEPWDPPARFLQRYLPSPGQPSWVLPPWDDIAGAEETRRIRANYAGEVTCVDYWVGQVLKTIRELGLFENSVVVFLSDHGTLLGEQGQFLKGAEKLRAQVTHVPLLVRLPGKKFAGKRISGFVQMPDVMPTLLSLLGLKAPGRVTGNNVWPLVTGETKSAREHVFHGYEWIGAVRDHEWNYSEVVNAAGYPGTYRPQLYNATEDPEELVNVAERYPDVARRMGGLLRDYLASGEKITRGSFHERESLG